MLKLSYIKNPIFLDFPNRLLEKSKNTNVCYKITVYTILMYVALLRMKKQTGKILCCCTDWTEWAVEVTNEYDPLDAKKGVHGVRTLTRTNFKV